MYSEVAYGFAGIRRWLAKRLSPLTEFPLLRRRPGLLAFFEFLLIILAWMAFGFLTQSGSHWLLADPWSFGLSGLFWGSSFTLMGLFDFSYRAALLRSGLRVERALLNWLLAWAFLVTLAALLHPADATVRVLALTAFLLCLPVVLAVRHQVIRLFCMLPGLARRERIGLLQIGDGEGVSRDQGGRHRLVHARRLTAAECLELPHWKVQDFIAQALSADASPFLVTAGRGDTPKIDNLAPMFRDQPKPVTFILDGASRSLSVRRGEGQDGGVTSPAAHDFGKRLLDVVVATSAIFFLLPVLVLVALAVCLSSPGPIIFRQSRNGLHGREFTIYKFRSMRVEENGDNVRQATRNDDRVTAVGRFIRRTSLDELPQLFNVLMGDMSLVGPRPHAIAHDRQYRKLIPGYTRRWAAKPGITGQAQISGLRGETPEVSMMAARIEQDIWYVKNWSLMLDIKILFATLVCLIRHRDIY
jgi:putative colanic acid biosynthesis UDP-glucose lipid carrier transferase